MSLLNTEELKRQIKEGTFTSLDDITNEFKAILKEVIQTASGEELTSHLGYDKHQMSAPEYLDTAAGVHVDSTKLRIFSWSL